METAGARKYPSCTLASKVIRNCLQSELVLPLVNKNYWATALRLTWRAKSDQVEKSNHFCISLCLFSNGVFVILSVLV